MDLDSIIAKMEADLSSLRRARELAQRYSDGEMKGAKAAIVSPAGAPGWQIKNGKWFSHLPEMLQGGALSARQIQKKLKEMGTQTSYSTIHSWLKKAVDRGEYKKRGTAYRRVEQPHAQPSGQEEAAS